jgi:hypothetical protein
MKRVQACERRRGKLMEETALLGGRHYPAPRGVRKGLVA